MGKKKHAHAHSRSIITRTSGTFSGCRRSVHNDILCTAVFLYGFSCIAHSHIPFSCPAFSVSSSARFLYSILNVHYWPPTPGRSIPSSAEEETRPRARALDHNTYGWHVFRMPTINTQRHFLYSSFPVRHFLCSTFPHTIFLSGISCKFVCTVFVQYFACALLATDAWKVYTVVCGRRNTPTRTRARS